ncbi:hypothetical protein [Metabacillus bambusae]|uniref:Uncharacterized protein n=1 Tax=Metabacillus bambusae TaxID=2795218 RepID=A0ABS3MYT7_9BACI|nr:hypothetical protein [Metabacillus bambusae]MBO1511158.1 hypothetical protein [Metabacillus bambusae]
MSGEISNLITSFNHWKLVGVLSLLLLLIIIYNYWFKLSLSKDLADIEKKDYHNIHGYKSDKPREYLALKDIVEDADKFLFKELEDIIEQTSMKDILALSEKLDKVRGEKDKNDEEYRESIADVKAKSQIVKDAYDGKIKELLYINKSLLSDLKIYKNLFKDYEESRLHISSVSFPEGHIIYEVHSKYLEYVDSYNVQVSYEKTVHKPQSLNIDKCKDSRLIAAYDPNRYFHSGKKFASFRLTVDTREFIIAVVLDAELMKQLELNNENAKIKLKEMHFLLRQYLNMLYVNGVLLQSKKGEVNNG